MATVKVVDRDEEKKKPEIRSNAINDEKMKKKKTIKNPK